jgi:hypothetical protein
LRFAFERAFSLFVLAAFVLGVASVAPRAYTDYSFSVSAQIDGGGNAHVVEKSVFNLDTEVEREEFDAYQSLGKTTIADWRKFSRNVKYHFTGSVGNLRIIAAREFQVSYATASISLEYDVAGIFSSEQQGGRIKRFALDSSRLSFGGAETEGEIALGNNMEFSLLLPSDATMITTAPEPGVSRPERNKLVWKGPIVGKWDVSYYREKPLTTEVTEFFSQLYTQLSTSWFLVLLAVVFVALAGVTLFKARK